jgi:modulator of FtsH protease
MDGFRLEHWHDFFIAQAGAGAALAGLVFVAISINLQRIMGGPTLVGRAAEALILLLAILIVAMVTLIPGQDRFWLGGELILAGVIFWIAVVWLRPPSPAARAAGASPFNQFVRIALGQLGTVPIVIAGASLAAGWGGGLYWLAAAFLFCLAAGVTGAWVLLIEILR